MIGMGEAISWVVNGAVGIYALKRTGEELYQHCRPTPYMERLTVNMTEAARKGQGSRAYGREGELAHLISKIDGCGIIILEGRPGVGKSALVEELAYRSTTETEPSLRNTTLLRFEPNKVFDGGLRKVVNNLLDGGLDDKIAKLFAEIIKINQEQQKRVILFIDEIQDLLRFNPSLFDKHKEDLARDNLVVIGATTDSKRVDYWLEHGGSSAVGLKRRVARIVVNEPTLPESVQMLENGKALIQRQMGQRYELTLQIESSACEAAVLLASHHRSDGKELSFPDKAFVLLRNAISYACSEVRKRGQDSLTFTERDIQRYLEIITKQEGARIAEALRVAQEARDEEGLFKERNFPVLPASQTAVAPIVQMGAQCEDFFASGSKELLIKGSSKEAILVGVHGFATRRDKVIVSCSTTELAKCWQRNPAATRQLIEKSIQARISEYGDRLILLFPDGCFLSQDPAVSSPFLPPELPDALAPLAHIPGAQQAAQVVQHYVAPRIPQNGLRPPSTPSSKDEIHALLKQLVQNGRISSISIVPPSEEADLELPCMSLSEEIDWLQEQSGCQERSLCKHLLYTLHQGNKPPLDMALKVLKGSAERTVEAIQRQVVLQTGGLWTPAKVAEAWEVSQHLDRPCFQVMQSVAEGENLSSDLAPHLSVLLGADRLLWIEEKSQALRNLWKAQIATYYLKQSEEVIELDLSGLHRVNCSPDLQKKAFEEQMTEFQKKLSNKRCVLVVREEDLAQSYVQKPLLALAKQGKCKLVCFADSREEIVSKKPSENPGLIEQGLDQLRDLAGLRPASPAAVPPIVSPSLPVDIPLLRYKVAKAPVANLVSFTYERLSSARQAEQNLVLKEAYERIYSFLHANHDLSCDQIAQEVENDFVFFQTPQGKLLDRNGVIAYLAQKFGARFDCSLDDLRYAVDPDLTSYPYRIWKETQQALSSVWNFCVGPLQQFSAKAGTVLAAFWTGNALRTLLRRLFF